MTGRASTPKKPGPTYVHGAMEPPATPRPGHNSTNATGTTPTPVTPGGRKRMHDDLDTPQLPPNSPSPVELTPGGSQPKKKCTIDEPDYKHVNIHTAKCTQCDKRNGELMRRCPGCTFQICKPCYEKRLTEGLSLLHGNMPTPGTPKVAAGGRTPRNYIAPSTPGGPASKMSEEIEHEDIAAKEKPTPTPAKLTAKKRALKKPKVVVESEQEMSSQDEFDPDEDGHTSPTPASKRRRTELSFAESATATAIKSPPATRATRRKSLPGPGPSYRKPSPSLSDIDIRNSVGVRPSEIPFDELLYEHGVRHYDEPLLGRQQPVMSNPVARIPAIIARGGAPRRQPGETLAHVQEQVRDRAQWVKDNVKSAQEETIRKLKEQRKKWRENGYKHTVQGFVEKEASLHKDDATENEDEFAAFLNSLKGAAWLWAKKTYKKLTPAELNMVRPGTPMEMRLDVIDRKWYDEIANLMEECVIKWKEDDGGPSTAQPAPAQPE